MQLFKEGLVINPPSTNGTLTQPDSKLRARYHAVRNMSEQICRPLTPEDCVIQSMPDASPIRWHLAHTTWFFETFVLKPSRPGYSVYEPAFEYLFNSYYNQVGEQFPRSQRGLLSRPGMAEVMQYRQVVDHAIDELLEDEENGQLDELFAVLELGLHHEQQHQELMLTDVKHLFSCNPCSPVYRPRSDPHPAPLPPMDWMPGDEGVRWIGHDGEGFAYDNEGPRHEVLVQPHQLASRLVTCGEFLDFIDSGGYERPELWLSLGWQTVTQQAWRAPLYWQQHDGQWNHFTLAGREKLKPNEPVCHVSFFEADAYARWAGCRLPSEAEWELAAAENGDMVGATFAESQRFHPASAPSMDDGRLQQLFGDVWEWTASPYTPYPGYQAPEGAIGEYNGKFMCNQYVLRGGSCATSRSHIRATYRNFFPPEARWQFTGIRLAK
jgi:ergothioneine biosynthesis protein EgtB